MTARAAWPIILWKTAGICLVLLAVVCASAAPRYSASGLVVQLDRPKKTLVVSCDAIPGVMDPMMMSFSVRNPNDLQGLQPGTKITFTIVAGKNSSFAETIHVVPFESLEPDPSEARRLKILENAMKPQHLASAVSVGDLVPDFSLTDQAGASLALSQLRGKVVGVTFVYVRCPLPNYCFRLSSNFGRLQQRFKSDMGRNLVLLTIIIDPVHDLPDAVSKYAHTWHADPNSWHFLIGSPEEVQTVCARFDMNYYPEEALLVHSFHTVLIDRSGRLAANIEGNEFTAKQLGDLVQVLLHKPN
ncbi:MAG TPA: SCO family protein [Candidatus Limnocylindrales bacterium]|nr:SCO family protein [Candidatus Limnocylindrales bacterium]